MAERRRPRPASLRTRITAVAVVVVGLATGVGAALLLALFRESLLDQLEISARVRAAEIDASLAAGLHLPDLAGTEDLLVQLVDPEGQVVDANPNASGQLVAALPARDDAVEIRPPQGSGSVLAVTRDVTIHGNPHVLVVALSAEPIGDATAGVVRLLAVGLPVLLALVAATTWIGVGRALATVESVRREVATISVAELDRRVPVPDSEDEVARLARTMNAMLARLEDGQARQRRFVADASHELRSPIASIRQHAEVALAHPQRVDVVDLASTVLAEDLRIQHLVADLLLLAAADERSLVRTVHPVDLDDLVFDIARDLRAAAGPRVDTTAVSAARVRGDPAALRRLLRNLADNATRHARTQLAFTVREQDGTAVVVVDDDGPGIPVNDRERVLQRFVRLDPSRTRDVGGSGLGLAIVTEIATAHGGRVVVEQGPLGGARIRVTLPRR